jgi:hypothetical protein
MGMLSGGGGGDMPDSSRYFPCHASVSFAVQSRHEYLLKVLHTDLSEEPEEIRPFEVATESGHPRNHCRVGMKNG